MKTLLPAPARVVPAKKHNLFEVIDVVTCSCHWKFDFQSAFTGIRDIDKTLEFGRRAEERVGRRLNVGLVTQPYEPLKIQAVVAHYGVNALVTSPRDMVALLRQVAQRTNSLGYGMANLFFWKSGGEVRLVVLFLRGTGKNAEWCIRSYAIDNDTPDWLTGCRMFIPA